MKKLSLIFCLAAAALLPSCNKDDRQPEPQLPALTLQSDTVYVSPEGGEAQFSYSIENPVEGAALKAEPQAEWISDVTVGENTVTFNVSGNTETSGRTAGILLSYDSLDDTVYVKQNPTEITYTDLGAYANCYIVSSEGNYFFNTGKVTGGQIDGIESDFSCEFIVPFLNSCDFMSPFFPVGE